MRTYFITVRSFEDAIAVDQCARWVRTLPATELVRLRCCAPEEKFPIPEAYIYKVEVPRRADAEKARGVIRCRAQEPARYKTVLFDRVC